MAPVTEGASALFGGARLFSPFVSRRHLGADQPRARHGGPRGRKRHIITDTEGHLVGLQVHAVNIRDRDGAVGPPASIRSLYPWLRRLFADGAYAGDKLPEALTELGRWIIEVIKRCDRAEGFEVLLRRWVVDCTFAWLGRCRRLAKNRQMETVRQELDHEYQAQNGLAPKPSADADQTKLSSTLGLTRA